MHSYLFFLGQTTDLCRAELAAVAQRLNVPSPTQFSDTIDRIDSPELLDAQRLQDILGGTIKIVRMLQESEVIPEDEVEKFLLTYLEEHQPKRFLIAELGRDHKEPIDASWLKNQLQKMGIKTSYKDTSRSGANSALLKSSKATELHVIQVEKRMIFGVTEAVQDVNAWSLRDVGKPKRDVKRGMLQPKVARMMLNLGITAEPENMTLLDPFCGTATVLIEGTVLGIPVALGSDISPEAIEDARANLEWWRSRSDLSFTSEVVIAPVERLETTTFKKQPTLIVTEPFLGKMTPKEGELPGIIRGLEKMYKGMFRAFGRVLPVGGRVVILLPSYRIGKHALTVEQTFLDAQHLGFTLQAGPYRAGRPDSATQRNAYVFEKTA